ncbi:glycine--tRNA ligase subunit beta [Kiloniella sp. b19]|uniref:glycine--tRNA ligase subunit beta n=1 Tax=Kiloniella sp. GXU_MW_B19 TaxID=3141326 RepID=UPI0031E01BE7
MADFFLELHCEEIPARMQHKAADDLARLVTERLKEAGLEHGAVENLFTPRRMALSVLGLPDRQPDVRKENKGPKVGAPEKALEGFMRANGLNDISEATVQETPKGQFYFVVEDIAGRPTADVLPDVIVSALNAFPWPKSMKWGHNTQRWVRPLHSIVALLDGQVLQGAFELGDRTLEFGNSTKGLRFPKAGQISPETIEVSGLEDYCSKMAEANIMVDAAEREAFIVDEAAKLCAAEGLSLKEDKGLLREVTGLVERPVVMIGTIEDSFMELPDEVLSTSMREHQKYFSTLRADGSLANRFVFVANTKAEDGGKTIVAGNERVLSSRLSDARFFWDQDRAEPLENRNAALEKIVFQKQLGTVWGKVSRMVELAGLIAGKTSGDVAQAKRAATLSKADLTSGMVYEFPELQGIMGRYYAQHGGEDAAVADAIATHYAPAGPSDDCPSAPASVAVALADKLDTLVGFFGISELPTGSKDPFALRRSALGVIRLITENGLRLNLRDLFAFAYDLYEAGVLTEGREATVEALMAFFGDRLKVTLKDKGVRHDLVSAVFARGDEDDLVRLLARVGALSSMLATEEGANLLAAYKRAANIVRIEEKKDKTKHDGPVRPDLLEQAEEKALHSGLLVALETARPALEREEFGAAMAALSGLRAAMDDFFDQVTVNAEAPEVRANRLALLSMIGQTLGAVADFSRIEG